MTKQCKFCSKKLAYNNKVGFCLSCIPGTKILNLFNEGMTITQISLELFNSTSGNYRELIRTILKEKLGNKFIGMRKKNKAKLMFDNRYIKKLPLDFIKKLHEEGKLATQIHKALMQKGYKLHLQTLRKILNSLGLDYKTNYYEWLSNRGKVSKNKKKIIKELWMNGESIKSISKVTSFAELTVKQYLHSMGYKTKLLQFYYSEPSNKEEQLARKHLENKGFEVKKCFFLCQRNLDKSFEEILSDKKFPFPSDLRSFCRNCPIQKMKFEEQELYDFVIKKADQYCVVEVKKVYNDPYRRAHFTLGQFLNLSKIIKKGITFKLILFDRGTLYEKEL